MFSRKIMKIILTTVFFSACVRFASAIHCFECSSVNNSMCLDPTIYDQDTLQRYMALTECRDGAFSQGHKEFFCRKIVQTILRKGHEAEVRVARGCGWVRSRRECYKADNDDHLETVCQCFQDGCNAAGELPGGWAVPLMIICGIALFNK